MATLVKFLNDLVAVPGLEAEFDKDPWGTMAKRKLGKKNQQLLMYGTLDELRKAVQTELPGATVIMIKMRP
jgi:hypothetical protein